MRWKLDIGARSRIVVKVPDYPAWLKSTIHEIKELEKMRCWNVVKLSSLPHGAKLISYRLVSKLKYCDGTYEHIVLVWWLWVINKKKGVITLKAFLPLVRILPFVLCLPLLRFPVGIL